MTFARLTEGPRAYVLLALLGLALYLPGISALPATDRDEARFAQATRQMVETGDYLHIRFQDAPRSKKPAGIHWLQAAAVHALAGGDTAAIWPYRVPSALGALAAVLALFALARPVLGTRGAFLGALALETCLLLAIEGRLATTDAVLLATVIAAQGALLRVYAGARAGSPPESAPALLFWAALGLAVLVKGPVAPAISFLTVAALLVADWRTGLSCGLLRRLRPLTGLLLAAAIAAPWFIAVSAGEDGFIAAAVTGDLLPKLLGGQESHGAPPGSYLLLAPLTLWPAALFAPLALAWAWHHRREPAPRMLLAWLVPAWLGFEIVPTKLAHYVLPLYPALALMIGAAVADDATTAWARRWYARLWLLVWVPAGAGIALILPFAARDLDLPVPGAAWLAGAAALLAIVFGTVFLWRGRPASALAAPGLLMVPFAAAIFALALPAMSALWPSVRAEALIARHRAPDAPPVAAAGFHEPSLVFALGTDTVLTDAAGAARHVAAGGAALALIEAREEAKFLAALAGLGRRAAALGTVSAVNTARGRPVRLTLYRATEDGT